jgi:hypothetical protein
VRSNQRRAGANQNVCSVCIETQGACLTPLARFAHPYPFCPIPPQISLLEGRGGILSLLDEECFLPRGSESALVDKLHALHASSPAVYARPPPLSSRPARGGGGRSAGGGNAAAPPRLPGGLGRGGGGAAKPLGVGTPPPQFVVRHYAADVVYTVDGWIDRNRGLLRTEVQVRMLEL